MAILIGAPVINMSSPIVDGKYMLMDMGISGAKEFKNKYKNAIFVYVIPPNIDRLLSQMKDRSSSRLLRSKAQISSASEVCDWLVINDDPKVAANQIEKIMHIIKENMQNISNLDEETIKYLFTYNLHNLKNKEFLEKFYEKNDLHPEIKLI